jgi:hypothetical protein
MPDSTINQKKIGKFGTISDSRDLPRVFLPHEHRTAAGAQVICNQCRGFRRESSGRFPELETEQDVTLAFGTMGEKNSRPYAHGDDAPPRWDHAV